MVHYGKLMITLEVETVCNTGSASNSERCARLHGKSPKGIKSWYEKTFAVHDFAKPSRRS